MTQDKTAMMTPMQEAISYITSIFGMRQDITQDELKKFLKTSLPYEKQFAGKIWEVGAFSRCDAEEGKHTDFETYYNQTYKQQL